MRATTCRPRAGHSSPSWNRSHDPSVDSDVTTTLRVEAGAVVVLRLYDVAFAIDLARLEPLMPAGAQVERPPLARAEPKAIAFGTPPARLRLGSASLPLENGGSAEAEAWARVYDFGVVAIALRFAVRDEAWADYVALTRSLDRAAAAPTAAPLWTSLLERVRRSVAPAAERLSTSDLEEDYLLSVVNRWDRPVDAESVLREVDVAALLAEEPAEAPRGLSPQTRQELLRNRFSYYADDLAVLTWDHAFLVEPAEETDVAQVLEVANARLLELLYYDRRLDAELPRMYGRVAGTRRALRALSRRRYANLAHDLYTLVAEVTELTEKSENALKITEDVYLARVYTAALRVFRVPQRSEAVDRKLRIMRDTYQALYDEATAGRTELLEVIIVVLILAELVLAFLH